LIDYLGISCIIGSGVHEVDVLLDLYL